MFTLLRTITDKEEHEELEKNFLPQWNV